MDLSTLARALGGEVAGRQVLAPGPSHGARDRSLAVRLAPDAPGGVLVHSFAGDSWRDCLAHVRQRWGLVPRQDRSPWPRSQHRPLQGREGEDAARLRLALALWRGAAPLTGSPAVAYLAGRGISLAVIEAVSGHALRFHARCPRGREGERLPALLALINDAATGEPRGVHRTFLEPDGRSKAAQGEARMVLGRLQGGVVRLSPDEAVTRGLGLAEGLETALSVLTAGWCPVWAALTAGNLAQVPPLPGMEALTVFADHDPGGAGQCGAAQAVRRWRAAGREACALMPEACGRDFNDIVGGRS